MAETAAPGLRFLIVDDEEAIRTSLAATFRRLDANADISMADSGEQGLEVIAGRSFDVIISDQRMARMPGTEFLERAATSQPNAVRILVTAYEDVNLVMDALNHGRVHAFVTKPWSVREVLDLVKRLLAERQKTKDSYRDLARSMTAGARTDAPDGRDAE